METRTTKKDLTVDTASLARLLERGEPVIVLDVRPLREREEWFIPGSVHVDAYEALKRNDPRALDGIELPDDRLIITVCAAGRTSLTAAEQLRLRGKRAASLEGGMRAWSLAANTAEVALRGTTARVVQVRRTGKGCLSYLVGAGDEAAVIDASLPPETYVRLTGAYGWRIVRVLDTHIHADHLSRSRRLAEETGARLLLPEQQRVSFPYEPVRDGDVLSIGGVTLRTIRTPGHTHESTCYLLGQVALFTGDTLFTNGVGRPDLEASPEAARERAALLHDALQRLVRQVSGEALVLPGHTSEPVPFDGEVVGDTLAAVQARVEALSLPKEVFVERLLGRIPPTPPNYERIVRLNEAGDLLQEGELELEAGANRCAIS